MCPLKKIYCIQLKILHSESPARRSRAHLLTNEGFSRYSLVSCLRWRLRSCRLLQVECVELPPGQSIPFCAQMQVLRHGRSRWRSGTLSRQGEGGILLGTEPVCARVEGRALVDGRQVVHPTWLTMLCWMQEVMGRYVTLGGLVRLGDEHTPPSRTSPPQAGPWLINTNNEGWSVQQDEAGKKSVGGEVRGVRVASLLINDAQALVHGNPFIIRQILPPIPPLPVSK